MVVATRAAPSVKTLDQYRLECLQMILANEITPFFIRPHLNREFIVGLIGLRGDGKSGSGATISTVDYGIRGVPVWSNMDISCDITIDDATAQDYGLRKGGDVHIQSNELDKEALLDLDERYAKSFIWIDEINVQYSNVRRFMSNTNVDFNTVVQELRKFHTSMGYSVIDEMFIDPQLRTLTDIFIKCEDTALSVAGLEERKPTGVDFKWTIYPMSGYLVGRENSYYATKKALPPVYFHFRPWRGVYNTDKFQRKGKYSMTAREKDKAMQATITTEESEEVRQTYNKWGWLEEKAIALKASKRATILPSELWQYLGLAERGLTPARVAGALSMYGIQRDKAENMYHINNYNVESLS